MFFSRLSPPTISDTSGLQVNFASIPDQAAPDLIEVGIIWSFPCFFLKWLRIWYHTPVRCWRWYRYGYRYLSLHHLLLEWIQKVCQYSAMCHRCQGPGIGLFVVDVLDSQESLRQSQAAKPAQADAQDSEVKCRLAWPAQPKKDFPEGCSQSEQWQCDGLRQHFLSLLGLKMHWAMLKLFGCRAKQAHFFSAS